MGEGFIRTATPQDLDALVDIYIECFPERVTEVFGGPQRRTFIRDSLCFYLSWDPESNWVYVQDGAVVGILIAPCRYSPWRAALAGGQIFRWLGHFLSGKYGFPLHILKRFLIGGFAFNADPMLKRVWGRPYIHLLAVRRMPGRGVAHGLLGIGSQLVHWMIAVGRKQGIHCWWGVVQSSARPFWKRMGARIFRISTGEYLGVLGTPDPDVCPPEGC